MEWNPCSIAPKKYVRCDRYGLFVAEMNSLKNNYTRFVYITAFVACDLGFLFGMLSYVPQRVAMVGLPHVIVYQWHNFLFITMCRRKVVTHTILFLGSLEPLPWCIQCFLICFIVEAYSRISIRLCHWPLDSNIHPWYIFLKTLRVYFHHSFPQVWQWVFVHTVPAVSLLLLVPVLSLMSSLIASVSPCVETGSKGPGLYGRIVISVISWPLGGGVSFDGGFSSDIHIL